LIVFGGVLGIEQALKNDDQLQIGDPALLFDFYLNTIPEQGTWCDWKLNISLSRFRG
jgi:Putative RNA methyltransferase